MQRHRQRDRDPQPQRRRELHRRDAPSVEETVDGGRGHQRHGEPVQLRLAGVMVVIVRTARAHRIGEAVDQQQQSVAGAEQAPG